VRSSSLSLVLTLFFGFFVSYSQPESECDSQPESECEHFSVSKFTQFDYSYVGICKHRCVDLSSAVSLALSLALSLPLSLSPFPQYACSANFFHSLFCSLSPAIPSTFPPDYVSLSDSFSVSLPLSSFSPPTFSSCPQPPSLDFVRTRTYVCTYPHAYRYIDTQSVIKVGLGISRANADCQRNPVYNTFHRFFCGNETIRR
jgi:hypothetical protein